MDRLTNLFAQLDELEPTRLRVEIERRMQDGSARSSPLAPLPGRGARLVAAIVAIAVFAGAAAWAWTVWQRVGPEPASPDVYVWGAYGEGFTELPAFPEVRNSFAVAWTGSELFVWGGNRRYGDPPHFDDGWSFDPTTRSWETLPPSPLSGRSWATAVWTGSEVLVWGGAVGYAPDDGPKVDGAAYDPASRTWRELPQAPMMLSLTYGAAWTGSEMIAVGEHGAAAYDPERDRWRSVAPSPMQFDRASMVWTGREVILYGDRGGPPVADGVALDPASNTWRGIPQPELPAWRGSPGNLGIDANANAAVWDGVHLVAMDYGLRVAAFDPAGDTWASRPPLPVNQCEGPPSAASDEGWVMAQNCGEIALLEPGAERWHLLTTADGPDPGGLWLDPIAADGAFLLLGNAHPPRFAVFVVSADADREPTAEDAWDVAAAFASLRTGYPYDADTIAPEVQANLDQLLSGEALFAFEDLWAYYWGFKVLRVEGDAAPFVVTVRFVAEESFTVRLTIAPGTGLDGQGHDLVIVGAERGE